MPYDKREELPDSVKNALQDVPHAQDIYKEAYNNAYEEYKDPEKRKNNDSREEVSHAVAWSAVENKYSKGEDGKWHPKENL